MTTPPRRSIIAPPENNKRRSRNILYATIALVAIILIVAVAFASHVPKTASEAPTQAPIKVGDAAPPFAVSTTAGPFDLAKVAQKPVFVEVFATWCPHCQREVPALNALYRKYGTRVDFVSVSGSNKAIDNVSDETQQDVIAFAQQFKVEYPIAFDPTLDVAKKYLLGGYPSFVLVDKNKKVTFVDSGELPAEKISLAIDKAL